MNHFGMPLVPSALALWAINFIDRIFIAQYKGQAEVGVYSVAVRISSAIVFLMIAFRLAWPAFAYSIEDDREAKRTYSFVLTYLLFFCAWMSVALGVLAPWLVHLLARGRGFQRASDAVALLAFAATAYAGYTVVAIGIGRARQTQFNWVVTGAAAVVNIGLNFCARSRLRDDRRGGLDARRVRRALRRDGAERAPGLPGRLSVAARRDARSASRSR